MELNPGKWSERLFEELKTAAPETPHSLEKYGQEVAAAVMGMAQEWVSRFTVIICTAGAVENSKEARDIVPGSGVIVRLNAEMYGVLTAAHVLRRGDNSRDSAAVAVLAAPRNREQGGDVRVINLPARPCTVAGFENETEDGPDIAIVPLASREWRILEGWGMVGYNLDKKRWLKEDKAELGEMEPWVLSIINGVRCEASQIVHGHTDGEARSLAMVASDTRVEVVGDRGGYDYLELPSETTENSYPTHWKSELPGTAAEEIDDLYHEGVTRRVWGGTSGAGVWNLVIGTHHDGRPNGRVLAELAGICYYANPDKGCIIAHGAKSISNIAVAHIEKEAIRYHSRA